MPYDINFTNLGIHSFVSLKGTEEGAIYGISTNKQKEKIVIPNSISDFKIISPILTEIRPLNPPNGKRF
jgi:hypothetical protein